MKESDLYPPLQAFFNQKGYTVQGEVKDCDIALVREDELIIIEMKLGFNLALLMQAVDRQTICDTVYLAIPRPTSTMGDTRHQGMLSLVRRLDLGLIFVALDSPMELVEIVRVPQKTAKQTARGKRRGGAIRSEVETRKFNLAVGGVTGQKIPTAYREQSIQILCTLALLEQSSPALLHQEYSCSKKAGSILGPNYYRWFQRVEHGIYEVSKKGHAFLQDTAGDFREIIDYYNNTAQRLFEVKQKETREEAAEC